MTQHAPGDHGSEQESRVRLLAADTIALGRQLFRAARHDDFRMSDAGQGLIQLGCVLQRMAESGPEHLAAREKPAHELSEDEELSWHRAMADLLSFIAVADYALARVARVMLRRFPEHAFAADAIPFTELVKVCDEPWADPAIVRPARRLCATLQVARNRLVAHELAHHSPFGGWSLEGTLEWGLWPRVPADEQAAAIERLNLALAAKLAPDETLDPHAALEAVTARAPWLTSKELRALSDASRVLGHVEMRASDVTRDLLALARLALPGGTPAEADVP